MAWEFSRKHSRDAVSLLSNMENKKLKEVLQWLHFHKVCQYKDKNTRTLTFMQRHDLFLLDAPCWVNTNISSMSHLEFHQSSDHEWLIIRHWFYNQTCCFSCCWSLFVCLVYRLETYFWQFCCYFCYGFLLFYDLCVELFNLIFMLGLRCIFLFYWHFAILFLFLFCCGCVDKDPWKTCSHVVQAEQCHETKKRLTHYPLN